MKKITAILMAMIFALSAFSVMGYAEGETTEVSVTRTEKWLSELNETREVHMNAIHSGKRAEMFMKGDKIALKMHINDFVSAVMVQSPEGEYLYFSHFPFFYMDFDEYYVGVSFYELGFGIDGRELVRSYEMGNYHVEEYRQINTNKIHSYYFIGDELKYIEQSGSKCEIVSTEVSDKEVSLPWYAMESKMMVMFLLLMFAGGIVL